MKTMIEQFKESEFAVNCKTEEEAKEFVKICLDNGVKWRYNRVKEGETFWNKHEETIYYVNFVTKWMEVNCAYYGVKTLTFEEFLHGGRIPKKEFCKKDLKTGMMVVTRGGSEFFVYKDVVTDIEPNGKSWIKCGDFMIDFKDYNDDLIYKREIVDGEGFDIVEVYLVKHPPIDRLREIHWNYRESDEKSLIWRREEVKELTIKEIEKMLGTKIKIIGE